MFCVCEFSICEGSVVTVSMNIILPESAPAAGFFVCCLVWFGLVPCGTSL